MSSYAVTKNRIVQWTGIILILGLFGGVYWYFEVRAGYKTNVLSPTGSLTSGLIGYWPFDSVSVIGTTALDRSTNKYNGLISGGAVVTSGRVSQAVNFDGTDDSMALGSTGYLNVNATADMTISGWFSRDTFTTDDVIVSKINGIGPGEIGYGVYISSGDQLIFKIGDGVQTYTVTTSMTFTTSVWTHFSIVWDQDSAVNTKIYVNGQSVSTSTSGTISDIDDTSHTNTFRIGALSSGGELFDGKLDEIRVYNRTLTASEVLTLYNFDGTGVELNSGASQAQGGSRLDSGLAGYWKLDDGSGTSATDSSTNGNTGSVDNMEGGDWVTGQIGGALDFETTGDGNERVNIPDSGAILDPTTITLSAWIKPESSHYGNFMSKGYNAHYRIRTDITTNTISFLDRGTTNMLTSTGTVTIGSWNHVVGIGDSSGLKIYINGVLAGSNSTAFVGSPTDSNSLEIGLTNGSNEIFDGSIDEVRIYNRALSADEVAELYRLNTPTSTDTGLDGYWSFNGKDVSGTTAYDRSGSGNNGTLTNGPTITPGKVGQALNFDGTNDSVVLNTSTVLKPALFTVSTWAYADTGSISYRGIYLPSYADGYNSGFLLYINNDGHAAVRYGNGSAPVGNITSGESVLGGWHYLVTTFDGTTLTLFVDGVEKASTTASTLAYTGSSTTAQIGAGNGTDTFDGKLDEFRLYGRAFSEAEIVAQYTAGRSDEVNSGASQAQGGSRLDSGLAGYWKLDDGSGTSATDASTNGNTGTLTNGPTWTTGQVGGAVNFDGTDDYIDLGTTKTYIDDGKPFTAAIWLNADVFSGVSRPAYTFKTNGLKGWVSFLDSGASYEDFSFGRDTSSSKRISFPGGFTTGVWRHVVIVYNGNGFNTTSNYTAYVDGASVVVNSSSTLVSIENENYIGSYRSGGSRGYWDGKLDDLRFYNRQLSADEVAELYRLTSPTGTDTGLKGYWSFNGKDVSGTTAYDRSGGGNNGTLTNGPTVTPGKVGQALRFDGTDDYVTVADVVSLEPTSAITVSAWIKRGMTLGTIQVIAAKGRFASASNAQYMIHFNASNFIEFSLGDGVNPSSKVTSTSTLTSTSQWYFIVGTYDGTTQRLYIDGVEAATPVSWSQSITTTADAFVIGNRPNFFSWPFSGSIEEVRIYSRSLTTDEISSLYNSGK